MPNITALKQVAISDLMGRIDQVKENPSLTFRVGMDVLSEVMDGTMTLVDPSNPLVHLLEVSAVQTAANAQETLRVLRKQYPTLAQDETDLYHHMSDRDYLSRFSTPADTTATLVFQWDQLRNQMVLDTAEECYKAIIPRDSMITVDGVSFMMQYPVVIRLYNNGVLNVSYDNTIESPVLTLRTNIIPSKVSVDSQNVKWLFFEVKVLQLLSKTVLETVTAGRRLDLDVPFSDDFYMVRAYHQHPSTGKVWHEMRVTHSDLVYDVNFPTTVLQVQNGSVRITIPTIYQTSGKVSGSVRFDIFTTKGKISYNFSNYQPDSFQLKLQALDEYRDLNIYTAVLSTVSLHALIDKTVNGGEDGLSFEQLRARAINNSTGDPVIPITNLQLETVVENRGFDLVKNVDTLTNRIFLASQKLPYPSDTRLLTAANISIGTVLFNLEYLKDHQYVRINGKRWTLLSKNLYSENNGIIKLLQDGERATLQNQRLDDMVRELNRTKYLYSPFYYVLDNSEAEFTTRIYELDTPTAKNLNFIRQNQTLQLVVNTANFQIEKTDAGYRLTTVTDSGTFYKQLPDGSVQAQLAFYQPKETVMAYINGTLVGRSDKDERIYQFDITTNYDIDAYDNIRITSATIPGLDNVSVRTNIFSTFHLFYTTTSLTTGFKPDESDNLISKVLLPMGAVAITHEEIDLQFGLALKNLWSRCRSLPVGVTYKRYLSDIPMQYTEDIYATDPVTGSMFTVVDGKLTYLKIHGIGDVVYDENNVVVYKHRKGDVILDESGQPIVEDINNLYKELDIFFVDGKNYFVNDEAYVAYNKEFAAIVAEWITEDIKELQEVLLEQSKIYFYPKNQLGSVKVALVDGSETSIPSEQSLVLELDVPGAIYSDQTIRQQLSDQTVRLLDQYISRSEVNVVNINTALEKMYGNSVKSFRLSGLGGSEDYRLIKLVTQDSALCLKRNLYVQQDGTLIMKEDVTINFHRVD